MFCNIAAKRAEKLAQSLWLFHAADEFQVTWIRVWFDNALTEKAWKKPNRDQANKATLRVLQPTFKPALQQIRFLQVVEYWLLIG